VAAMTDLFVLLTLHGAGDELQGIKRGIMELADVCVVNKADTDPAAANRAQSELTAALSLLTPHSAVWHPRVLQVSSVSGAGVDSVWEAVQAYTATVDIAAKRRLQTAAWFDELLREVAWRSFLAHTDGTALAQLRAEVLEGNLTPVQGVKTLGGFAASVDL
jgi:LAO/AO transport system kinase